MLCFSIVTASKVTYLPRYSYDLTAKPSQLTPYLSPANPGLRPIQPFHNAPDIQHSSKDILTGPAHLSIDI
ncbi:hypothetical protein BDV95DRAFT_573873 [Massariosphaeria phaeospora]|uniref:Uncharacterized protein n=1 Tax=Massariosphaeria phaeospora TaxID=100035 RepID=A0A7C8M725_9PLEO|nr:hypothetical protein BDV95DRAFT_573873 [Massariosphaeria phaeospora]